MQLKLNYAIGDAIRRLRVESNKTLRDIASSAFISYGYLSDVERGRKQPSLSILDEIIYALGVSRAEFWVEVENA
jgi:transcriptional regulator with XRE-family HTH domain